MQASTYITINAAQEMGELLPVWQPGILIWPDCQEFKKFEEEIGYKYTYNFWLVTSSVQPTGFSYTKLDPLISKIDKAGGMTIINLHGMPRWLTSYTEDWNATEDGDPVWESSPPRDYNKWKEIVYSVIKHYSVDCGFKNILYEPWNEPDEHNFWHGTPEEYFKLYQYAAFAVKEIENRFGVKVKIGGPRTATWHRTSWIYNLIKLCGANKLPLDFVSWHFYDSKNPRRMIDHRIVPRTIDWLKEYGFDPETPLIIDEWSMWPEDDLAPTYRNDEKYASFIPATLYVMENIGIHRQCFFELQSVCAKDRITPEYKGKRDFSVITPHGIIKPSYNSLLLLTKLGNKKLNMSISDDFYISGVATRDRGRISVLISHYVPIEPGKQKEQIAREIDINIRNLSHGCYHYERYLIDKNHSNSYAVRGKFLNILATIRVQCLEETKELMMKQRCAEKNIELFGEIADEISELPEKAREKIDSLSQSVREEMQKMMEFYAGLYYDRAVNAAKEINEWQEVRLQRVEEKNIEIKKQNSEYCAQLILELTFPKIASHADIVIIRICES